MTTKKLPHTHLVITVADPDGNVIATFMATGKEFKSGAVGYYGQGKVELDADTRFQTQSQLVLIGSKPAKPKKK